MITKDDGLASLVPGKNGKALSASGFACTKKHIGILLQQRYVNGVLRSTHTRRKKKAAKHYSPSLQ